jgi:hypothetical protein
MNAALQAAKLPKCPDPACLACQRRLRDVRPYRSIAPNSRLVLVHVLSRCQCGQRHIGVRALVRTFASLKFKGQKFYRYSDEHKAELDATMEFLTRGAQGGDAQLQDLPDQPQLVVWFENTLYDAGRAGAAGPVPGLLAGQLPVLDGITVLEARPHDPVYLAGVLVAADGPDVARDFVQRVRDAAAQHGTVAWVRRYDVAEHAVRWDTHAPAPGSHDFLLKAG